MVNRTVVIHNDCLVWSDKVAVTSQEMEVRSLLFPRQSFKAWSDAKSLSEASEANLGQAMVVQET